MISATITKVVGSYVHLEGICIPIFFIISFSTVVLEKSAKYKKFRSPGCFMLIA
jgi:surface polysaccharide O-acyltransferase-like enzyme